MRKVLSTFAMLAMAFAVAAGITSVPAKTVKADGDIEINETNFPDEKFRKLILEENYGKDGILTEAEISDVKLFFAYGDIASLKGIEYFTSLEALICDGNKLTSLDLSKNTKLKKLDCRYNDLTSLDLTNNTALEELYCQANDLTCLDLSKNTALVNLSCYENKLTSLDLSKNIDIEYVKCGDYEKTIPGSGRYQGLISSIDLSGCPKLKQLNCSKNPVKELDLSNNPDLVELHCCYCSLEKLDLSNNTNIESVYCDNCSLSDINVKGCFGLDTLSCDNNKLTSLDLSNLGVLKALSANNNQLTAIDLTNDNSLQNMYLSHNNLKNIDLSDSELYWWMDLSYNQLSSLDLSTCGNLRKLNVRSNKLTSINIDKTIVWELKCDDNQLKSLSINNGKIEELYCENNKLTSITIKNPKYFKALHCANNQLTKIKIYDNMSYISCYGNKIKELDISANETLKRSVAEGTFDVKTNKNGANYYSYCYHWDYSDNDLGEDVDVYDVVEIDPDVKIKNGDKGLMTMDKNYAEVICGKTLQLGAAFKESANDTTWKSSDETIATVDKTGKVKGKMAGTVTITAECKGKKAGCTLTVLYKDVTSKKDFWFKPTNELTAMNVVKGYDKQTKFKPANECTRAQMLTFIWRLKGEPKPDAKTCTFPDVKESDYFFKPVIWAVENGITTGYGDGTFKPQNVCTRAQTVTFLWRLAGTPEPTSSMCKFSDVKEKDYFFKPVIWASEKNIVAGYKDGTFKPQGKCLRRQMVTFLYKFNNATSEAKDQSYFVIRH